MSSAWLASELDAVPFVLAADSWLPEDAVSELRRTEVHEASHACASLQTINGHPRIVLTVCVDADGLYSFSGQTREGVPAPSPREALSFAADRAYVSMAGQIGEAKHCRRARLVFLPWSKALRSDRLALDAYAARVAPGYAENYRHLLYRRVAAEFERPAVWSAVRAIARKLEGVWPLEQARQGGPGQYVGELGAETIRLLAKAAGLPGRRS
jgi:hypothetical protein